MGVEYTGTIIVIPTRNRASLAEAAIRSVLQQGRSDVRVLVSDNSTSLESLDQLSRFCLSVRSDSLHYIRPPSSLRMTPHWDWALRVALKHWDYSHVSFLTDRMIFKPGALEDLAGIAKHRPDRIISYMHDRIADNQYPIRLDQHPWTGKLFQVASSRLLQLSSQSIIHEMLPRMLNTLVPRRVPTELEKRHGNFFDSHAPDFNFCYRALQLEESIVFYDAALLVHYALDRSNGAAASSGATGADREDYISGLKEQHGHFATPIPQILTARNCVAHEYCVARRENQSASLPALEMGPYLEAIAGELAEMTNPQLKKETHELLIAHGWKEPGVFAKPRSLAGKLASPRRIVRKLAREAGALRSRRAAKGSENVTSGADSLSFGTLEAAVDYAVRSARPRVELQPELEKLFGLVRLPLEDSQVPGSNQFAERAR
jgi:hypothetical protein